MGNCIFIKEIIIDYNTNEIIVNNEYYYEHLSFNKFYKPWIQFHLSFITNN